MIDARYTNEDMTSVAVVLAADERLGTMVGPALFSIAHPSPGNSEHDDLYRLVADGSLTIAPFVAPAPAAPDNPTLSDWRVALTLWGRIDEVTAKVDTLIASNTPAQAMLGKVAKERLEYANNVLRAQLLQLKDAFGFTADEIEESLWRAAQVPKGDLSGQWPLPQAA